MNATAGTAQAQEASGALSPARRDALTVRARELADADRLGAVRLSLLGKNIGLVSSFAEDPDAKLFEAAARALGAKVAHVRPSLSATSSDAEVAATARILGQLYDAIEFHGVPSDVVAKVSRQAGVPVFDGIARAEHPTARLADAIDGVASAGDRRRYVLQALLLNALA